MRSSLPAVIACILIFIISHGESSAQMSSVVNSLDDDENAYPWDDTATVDIDESIDGICHDAAGRCTFRAALAEAWYIGTTAHVTFSVAGSIVVDSNQGPFNPPPGSTIDGGGRKVALRGSGSFPWLMTIDSQTVVKGLEFRAAWNGLDVYGKKNFIGGYTASEGNLFLGMKQDAIFLLGDSNIVIGNQIGTGGCCDAYALAGSDTVYNKNGIFVMGSHNIIGDSIGTMRNVISRNQIGISMVGDDSGFVPCEGNTIRGNMIGTDILGVNREGNAYGIEMLYGSGHVIGDPGNDRANIICGSRESGILAGIGTDNVTIIGNLIGLNINQDSLGNENGIILGPGSSDCLVYNNLIERNRGYGIEIAGGHAGFNEPSTRHIIAGNTINHNGLGIAMGARATENVVGSSLDVDRPPNEIQSSTQGGLFIGSLAATPNEARLNTVRKNLFLDNYDEGIDIRNSQDSILPPAVESYNVAGGTGYVAGRHDRAGSLIDVYEGKKNLDTWYEGYTWLGSAYVQADSTFMVTFPDCGCPVVAVTATDPLGNTSMFSIFQQGAALIDVVDAMTSGWNMGSVPVNPLNSLSTQVFSGAMSNVFAYTPVTGYTAQTNVSVGPGYWVRYASATNQSITGYAVHADTFSVGSGWNLVGSITDPVPVSDVSSIPGGMISSNFFEYNGFYEASDTIRPGRAYWVKVGQAGSLVLAPGGGASPANRIRIAETDELPPSPPANRPDRHAIRPTSMPQARPFIVPLDRGEGGPRNGSARFRYWVPADGRVTMTILDRAGRQIASLVDDEERAGFHTALWRAEGVPDGTYLCKLETGGGVSVRSIRLGTVPGPAGPR